MTIKGVEEKYDLRKTSAKFVPLLVNHLHFGLFPYLGECRCITKQRTSLESTASYTWNFDFVKKMDLNGPVEVFIKKMFRRNWCTDPEIRNDPLLQLICFKNVTYSFIYLFTYSFIHVLFFFFLIYYVTYLLVENRGKGKKWLFLCTNAVFTWIFFSLSNMSHMFFRFLFCFLCFLRGFHSNSLRRWKNGHFLLLANIFYFWPTVLFSHASEENTSSLSQESLTLPYPIFANLTCNLLKWWRKIRYSSLQIFFSDIELWVQPEPYIWLVVFQP